jgi:hypothetical protein
VTQPQEDAELLQSDVDRIVQVVSVAPVERLDDAIENVERQPVDLLYETEASVLRELRRAVEDPAQ